MSDTRPEVAIFNLERTVTDRVYRDALLDVQHLEIGPQIPENEIPLHVVQQRELFLRWVCQDAGRNLNTLLDHTLAHANERTATWGKVIMQAQARAGRRIALLSSGIAHPIVTAYAEGLSRTLPDVEIGYRHGRDLNTVRGVPVGSTKPFYKKDAALNIIKAGGDIGFIADSFMAAMPFMRMAKHKLHSNPDANIRVHEVDRIYWLKSVPNLAKVILKGEVEATKPSNQSSNEGIEDESYAFDLSDPKQLSEFIAIITREDDAISSAA